MEAALGVVVVLRAAGVGEAAIDAGSAAAGVVVALDVVGLAPAVRAGRVGWLPWSWTWLRPRPWNGTVRVARLGIGTPRETRGR